MYLIVWQLLVSRRRGIYFLPQMLKPFFEVGDCAPKFQSRAKPIN
jgi:hypothetical protein